jgi:anti-anti-sigma factor
MKDKPARCSSYGGASPHGIGPLRDQGTGAACWGTVWWTTYNGWWLPENSHRLIGVCLVPPLLSPAKSGVAQGGAVRNTQSPQFEVIGCVEDGVFRIVPTGDLDAVTAPSLAAALNQAEGTDVEIIILDLRGVTFLDSAGARCLADAQERSMRNGERLLIIRGGPQVQRLLRMAQLDESLPLSDARALMPVPDSGTQLEAADYFAPSSRATSGG